MATVWVASLLVLVMTATVLAVGGVSATTARHAAQLAADLAALTGAGRIGVDDPAACAEAGRVAAANAAVLRACAVESTGLRTGEIRVEVARPQRWAGFALDARARARAARVPPASTVPTGLVARVDPRRDVARVDADRPICQGRGSTPSVRVRESCGSMIRAVARVACERPPEPHGVPRTPP